jgi:hypothetical protein
MKIRPKEKAEKKKVEKSCWQMPPFVQVAPSSRLRSLAQWGDLCYHLHVVYPGA